MLIIFLFALKSNSSHVLCSLHFPQIPCQLASYCLWPMGSTDKILAVRKKRETRVLLPVLSTSGSDSNMGGTLRAIPVCTGKTLPLWFQLLISNIHSQFGCSPGWSGSWALVIAPILLFLQSYKWQLLPIDANLWTASQSLIGLFKCLNIFCN